MRTIEKTIALVFVLQFVLYGSVYAQKTDWKPYQNSKLGFSMNMPATWEVQEEKSDAYIVVQALSGVEGETDTIRENLNVTTEEIPGQTTLKAYIDLSIENMKQGLTQFSVVKREDTTLSGQPAVRMIYEHTYNNIRFKVAAYATIFKGRAFIITCTAIPESFDKYFPIFEEVAKSFVLK